MNSFGYVRENYLALRDELDRSGHSSVEIVCVSKTIPREAIQVLVDLGVLTFGENRAQELKTKFQEPWTKALDLHFIGHLQTNKARVVSEICNWVDSVDSVKLVRALQKSLAGSEKILNVLVEVNTSGEAQKSGVHNPDEVYEILDILTHSENLRPRGLMTIGPFTDDPVPIQKAFRNLRRLFETVSTTMVTGRWDVLSIGMSNDYRIALDEGATTIRIGSSIFGRRS